MARLRRGQLEAGGVIVIRIRFGSLLMVLVALALTFVVVGCGDDKPAGDESADVNSEGLDASGCEPAEQPEPKEVDIKKPTEKLDPDKTYTAVFETNCGNFSVELDVENNPVTAGSFAHLVEEGVYDGTWFHRIITDFMNQGGDPKGDGTGGVGYTVREKPSGAYEVGTVAMAKTGADPAGTSGSQFFVITGQNGTIAAARLRDRRQGGQRQRHHASHLVVRRPCRRRGRHALRCRRDDKSHPRSRLIA